MKGFFEGGEVQNKRKTKGGEVHKPLRLCAFPPSGWRMTTAQHIQKFAHEPLQHEPDKYPFSYNFD